MTEVQPTLNRGQFIRNAAKGSLTLVGAGGVLASMDGVAFAKGASRSDVATLQVGSKLPTGFQLHIPSSAVSSTHAVLPALPGTMWASAAAKELTDAGFIS